MLLARLSSANCLQAFLWARFRRGFLLGRRPCKPTCCSVWRMVWALTSWPSTSATSKVMLAALFFEASFCTWRTAQGLNFFDRPLRGLFRVKPVLENLYDPGHCTVTHFQAVTELLIASAIFVESNNSNSQILKEFFVMRCHVEHPVFSMRELYSKNQILTALKQDTQICMVLSSRQKHEHDDE